MASGPLYQVLTNGSGPLDAHHKFGTCMSIGLWMRVPRLGRRRSTSSLSGSPFTSRAGNRLINSSTWASVSASFFDIGNTFLLFNPKPIKYRLVGVDFNANGRKWWGQYSYELAAGPSYDSTNSYHPEPFTLIGSSPILASVA